MTVAGLVLAAGEGRRFGGPKALAEVEGERLVDRAVRVLSEAGLPAYVVQGAAPLAVPGAEVVDNPGWAEGMGSSLRVGLASLGPDVDAAVVLLVDQPGLTAPAVRRVVEAAGPSPEAAVVVATYDGRRGHPVLLGRRHWTAVAEVAVGDRGARDFLVSRADGVLELECGDVATADDVDTAADLDRLRRPS